MDYKDALVEGYKDIVKQQFVIANDYKELLRMVQDDRDSKARELEELKEENRLLRKAIKLYDGAVERRA